MSSNSFGEGKCVDVCRDCGIKLEVPEKKVAFDSQNITFKSIVSRGTEIGGVFMILLDRFEEPWLAGKCSGRSVLDWRQTWMQRSFER